MRFWALQAAFLLLAPCPEAHRPSSRGRSSELDRTVKGRHRRHKHLLPVDDAEDVDEVPRRHRDTARSRDDDVRELVADGAKIDELLDLPEDAFAAEGDGDGDAGRSASALNEMDAPIKEDPVEAADALKREGKEPGPKLKELSDEQKAKHEKLLPEWQMVILSASVAGVAVILTAKLGECLARPSSTAIPSDEDKIKIELDEAKSRAEKLEQALREKHEAAQQETAAGDAAPGEPVGLDKLNSEELIGGMHARSRELESNVQAALEGAKLDEMMKKAEQLQAFFSAEMVQVQDRAKEWGTKEAQTLYEKVQAVAQDDTVLVAAAAGTQGLAGAVAEGAAIQGKAAAADEAKEKMTKSIPAFGLLVSASFAPAGIQGVYGTASSRVVFNGIVMAMMAGLGAACWHKSCSRPHVWYWSYAVFGVSALTVLTNSVVIAKAGSALAHVEEAKVASMTNTGNAVWDQFLNIKSSTKYLFKALFLYDNLVASWSYSLTKLINMLYVIVGAVGVYFSIMNVIEDTEWCEAKAIVTFMHVMSFIYVLLFTWTLVGLVLWLVMVFSGSNFVSSRLVKVAMKMDDANALGLPIFVTAVRSFILRSSLDLVTVQRTIIEEEISELETQAKEMATLLQARKAEHERLQLMEAQEKEAEDSLIEKYTAHVHEGLEFAKPAVSLLAAQQQLREQAAAAATSLQAQVAVIDTEAWKASAMATAGNLQEQAATLQKQATRQLEEHGVDTQAWQASAAAAAGQATEAATAVAASAQQHEAAPAPATGGDPAGTAPSPSAAGTAAPSAGTDAPPSQSP